MAVGRLFERWALGPPSYLHNEKYVILYFSHRRKVPQRRGTAVHDKYLSNTTILMSAHQPNGLSKHAKEGQSMNEFTHSPHHSLSAIRRGAPMWEYARSTASMPR